MPSFVDALIVLKSSKSASEIVLALVDLLNHSQWSFPCETMVIFNDSNEVERQPATAASPEDGLRLVARNPSLGGIQVNLAGQKMSIFLYGLRDFSVSAISLSVLASGYLANPKLKESFNEFVRKVHHSLSATRTISDFELLSPDSFWKQEVTRLKEGIFQGDYLVDLR
jgi:hypothetical protein